MHIPPWYWFRVWWWFPGPTRGRSGRCPSAHRPDSRSCRSPPSPPADGAGGFVKLLALQAPDFGFQLACPPSAEMRSSASSSKLRWYDPAELARFPTEVQRQRFTMSTAALHVRLDDSDGLVYTIGQPVPRQGCVVALASGWVEPPVFRCAEGGAVIPFLRIVVPVASTAPALPGWRSPGRLTEALLCESRRAPWPRRPAPQRPLTGTYGPPRLLQRQSSHSGVPQETLWARFPQSLQMAPGPARGRLRRRVWNA